MIKNFDEVNEDEVRAEMMESSRAPCLDADKGTRRAIVGAAHRFNAHCTAAARDALVELVELLADLDIREGEKTRFDAAVGVEVEQRRGVVAVKPNAGPAMQTIDKRQLSAAMNADGFPG